MTVTAALAESALAVSRVGDDPNPLNWWEQTIRQYENVNIVHWWIVAVFAGGGEHGVAVVGVKRRVIDAREAALGHVARVHVHGLDQLILLLTPEESEESEGQQRGCGMRGSRERYGVRVHASTITSPPETRA